MKLFTNGQATLMIDVNFSKVRIHLSQKKGIEFVNEMKWNVENIRCNLFLMWRKENKYYAFFNIKYKTSYLIKLKESKNKYK